MHDRAFSVLLCVMVALAAAAAVGPSPAAAATEPAPDFIVAQDGTGDFTTIQAAVDAVRDYTPVPRTIFVKNGVYREKLLVPSWKTGITLIGESVEQTIVDWDDHAGKGDINTFTSYTARISANDTRVRNITFRNSAGPVGQALAMFVEGDRVVFENCHFLGHQDTVFSAGEGARQFFRNVYIEGTTDFVFGPGTAFFEGCHIHSLRDSYITAASTPESVPHGFVFDGCRLTAAPGVTQVFLGRPWRDHARTVFLRTEMGAHIRPEGWHNWSRPEAERTVFYAELGSTGPGAEVERRVGWARTLSPAEAARHTREDVLCGGDCGGRPWFESGPGSPADTGSDSTTVHLIGDSTMSDKPDPDANPERGWGQMLPLFLDPRVRVRNHAVNGRSTRSFLDEGRWDAVLRELRPGDHVFIQFGHNDQKHEDPARFTNPHTAYRRNLQKFVGDARERGAVPVLFSSIVRRRFNAHGVLVDTHGAYPVVTRDLARELDVAFVDLQALTEELVLRHGPEGSKSLYVWTEPGEFAMYPDGQRDDTHLSVRGATEVARLAVEALRGAGIMPGGSIPRP